MSLCLGRLHCTYICGSCDFRCLFQIQIKCIRVRRSFTKSNGRELEDSMAQRSRQLATNLFRSQISFCLDSAALLTKTRRLPEYPSFWSILLKIRIFGDWRRTYGIIRVYILSCGYSGVLVHLKVDQGVFWGPPPLQIHH